MLVLVVLVRVVLAPVHEVGRVEARGATDHDNPVMSPAIRDAANGITTGRA